MCSVIQIDDTLISQDLLDQKFVCDLSACKGACCVEGEGGAPLEEAELSILDDDFQHIKAFLRPKAVEHIEKVGKYELDSDGDYVTPLMPTKECAYVVYDQDKTLKCGIEQAHKAGVTDFLKPISCHLYPVRLKQYEKFMAVNFHEWKICKAAFVCGEKLAVPVYQFLKSALVRKFGSEWFEALDAVYRNLKNK